MLSTSGSNRNATADLTSSRFLKTVCLYDWWLTKASEGFQGSRLAVGGVNYQEYPNKSKHSCIRQVQRIFTSSPIIKRHDAFSLETSDGICVVLKGLINKDRTMGNGFSSEIFNHFVFGFPPQWKECGLKYMGEESLSGVASPQEGLDKSEPSSLNKETLVNHSKVVSEEGHDAQILEKCSQDIEEGHDAQILEKCSQDIEEGLNGGDVINQDEGCGRNSDILSRPHIEPGIAIRSPRLKQKRYTIQETSYSETKRRTRSSHSKVISEETANGQVLKESTKRVPKAALDEGIGKEGRDIEEGQNCGDVMNPDDGCERNSIRTPRLKRNGDSKQGISEGKTKRLTQSNHSEVIREERYKTRSLKECSKHVPKEAIDEGVAEEGAQSTCEVDQGQNCGNVMNQDDGCERNSNGLLRPPIANSTPGLKRKRSTKQATSNSKIKRKISFDASGKSATEEAKESMSKISPDASSFKRSRSGRLLIPHMEYWRNQGPVYDRDRSITGIREDSTVTPLRGSRSEPPRK